MQKPGFFYGVFGQRLHKTESGVSKYYVTSGPTVLAEYKSTNELEAEYIYALGRMITKFDPARGYLWFYVDHLGSTRLIDGPDIQTDMRRDYSPFGQAHFAAGTDQAAYQFTGKELDNATGLYYFGARYYDRGIGRWLAPDPISSEFSPYSYVYNRPLNFIDRFGLDGSLPGEDEEGGGAGSGDPFSNSYFQRQIQEQFNAVWSASRGSAPGYSRWAGGTGSYLSNYRSPSGGRWEYSQNAGIAGIYSIKLQLDDKPIYRYGLIYGAGWVWSDPRGEYAYEWIQDVRYSRNELERIAFNTPPMSNTAPNPYSVEYHYRGVNAALMFRYGGNGPWGQFVRGSLVEFHELGVDPSTAHSVAYDVASQRVSKMERRQGYATAWTAAGWLYFLERRMWATPIPHFGKR